MITFPSTKWQNSVTGLPLRLTSFGSSLTHTNTSNVINITSGLFASASTTSSFNFVINSLLNPGSEQPND